MSTFLLARLLHKAVLAKLLNNFNAFSELLDPQVFQVSVAIDCQKERGFITDNTTSLKVVSKLSKVLNDVARFNSVTEPDHRLGGVITELGKAVWVEQLLVKVEAE